VYDATLANGTIRVIPGKFRESMPHERDPDSDHHIRCYPEEAEAIPVEIGAGGAVFFAYGTPHATGGNSTQNERAGVALHFLNTDQTGTARGGFEVSKRPLLADGGKSIYGKTMHGIWERLI